MHRVWSQAGDRRAGAALAEANRCLHATAAVISDAALRHCYLNDIAEHREIEALFAHQQTVECRSTIETSDHPADEQDSANPGA